MKQDEFERLSKLFDEMEKGVMTKDDEQVIGLLRAGVGILERFVVAVEKIAAQGEERVVITSEPVEMPLKWPPFEPME